MGTYAMSCNSTRTGLRGALRTARGFACVIASPKPSPRKSMTMKPSAARIVGPMGKASGPQRVGESGERCKVEVFSTDVRIEVQRTQREDRPFSRDCERQLKEFASVFRRYANAA